MSVKYFKIIGKLSHPPTESNRNNEKVSTYVKAGQKLAEAKNIRFVNTYDEMLRIFYSIMSLRDTESVRPIQTGYRFSLRPRIRN